MVLNYEPSRHFLKYPPRTRPRESWLTWRCRVSGCRSCGTSCLPSWHWCRPSSPLRRALAARTAADAPGRRRYADCVTDNVAVYAATDCPKAGSVSAPPGTKMNSLNLFILHFWNNNNTRGDDEYFRRLPTATSTQEMGKTDPTGLCVDVTHLTGNIKAHHITHITPQSSSAEMLNEKKESPVLFH